MPQAITTPTTAGATAPASTRRQALGGAVLAALSGAAFGATVMLPDPGEAPPAEGIRIMRMPSQPNSDAELLTACAIYIAAHQEIVRLEQVDAPEDVFERANDAVHDAVIRVSGLRATTPAGKLAKAGVCRAVLLMDEPTAATGRFDVEARRHDVLAASFLTDFLGGAMPLPASPPAAASPDAELIRLCADCDALQGRIDALYAVPSEGLTSAQETAREKGIDIAQQPLLDAQDPLLHRICGLRATTAQGRAARARTLVAWDKDPIWTHDDCWNSQLIGAIVRDTVREA